MLHYFVYLINYALNNLPQLPYGDNICLFPAGTRVYAAIVVKAAKRSCGPRPDAVLPRRTNYMYLTLHPLNSIALHPKPSPCHVMSHIHSRFGKLAAQESTLISGA